MFFFLKHTKSEKSGQSREERNAKWMKTFSFFLLTHVSPRMFSSSSEDFK